MDTIYVNMRHSSEEQIARINKILDTKFHGYHAPERLFGHSSRYGTLTIYQGIEGHATSNRPSKMLTLQQFFKKYDTKTMSFKEIICNN